MNVRLFHRRLFEASRRLVGPGRRVVCGVSGGADSVALLHGLTAVNEIQNQGWLLAAAHLNHGLRAGAAADTEFVRELAASLGLECAVESHDIRTTAGRTGESIEEAGRRVRYAFFQRVAGDSGATVVAVGHHADDQAETVIHRVVRGTGIRGLGGMSPVRPICEGSGVGLIRPLLSFRRAELRSYLAVRNLSYREDETNADTTPTRNRIRHRVLPLLERELNPGVVESLGRLADQARRMEEATAWIAAEALNRCRIRAEAGLVVLSAKRLAAAPEAIQGGVIRLALERLGVGLHSIGFERLEAARDLVTDNDAQRTVQLAGGAYAQRRGCELIIGRAYSSSIDRFCERNVDKTHETTSARD